MYLYTNNINNKELVVYRLFFFSQETSIFDVSAAGLPTIWKWFEICEIYFKKTYPSH